MSKKIMFSDKYGLTDAVLNGTKTMTRRFVKEGTPLGNWEETMKYAPFQVGEIVAIAQRYADIYLPTSGVNRIYNESLDLYEDALAYSQGWNNKMFVRADLMPHHIRITNIKVERLQEITDEDCLKEGVYIDESSPSCYQPFFTFKNSLVQGTPLGWDNARDAFAALIDKVGKKGDWDKNPWVFVYDFEIVD